MTTSYRTLRAPAEGEIEVKGSRFLGHVAPASDEQAARAVIEQARSRHWDARHHCSAFVLDPRGSVQRSSDDGEPAGTAGAPMLEVLRGRELTDTVAVVTRWFGGTLLGAGGLVRAYGDAVREALDAAEVVCRELVERVSFDVSHAEAGRTENDLRSRGFTIPDVSYGGVVTVYVDVLPQDRERLASVVAQLTSGRGALSEQGRHWSDRSG